MLLIKDKNCILCGEKVYDDDDPNWKSELGHFYSQHMEIWEIVELGNEFSWEWNGRVHVYDVEHLKRAGPWTKVCLELEKEYGSNRGSY